MERGKPAARVVLASAFALCAFAANSLLCRSALATRSIDPASFTFVRLASGAVVLTALARVAAGRAGRSGGGARDLVATVALFVYAIMFATAYVRLPTGTGALVLFGCVQVTMIAAGLRAGERPRAATWAAIAVAVAGLVGVTYPGLGAPDPGAAARMAVAGAAWSVYSPRGRKTKEPLASTATNFVWTLPLAALALGIGAAFEVHANARGLVLAASSGAIASGVGYAVWYTALPGLSATRAAVVQLAVPLLAADGGIVLLGEALSLRLVASAAAILGGVAFVVLRR